MKLRLLAALCIFSTAASAQHYLHPQTMNAHNIPYGNKTISYNGLPNVQAPVTGLMQIDTLIHSETYTINGSLTPGIHYAPLDHMAFLVPDPKASIPIPNAWADVRVPYTEGQMPNPALPEDNEKLKMKK